VPLTDDQETVPVKVSELADLRDSLKHIVEVAKDAPQPVRAIINTQLFIAIQKTRAMLGDTD
jgi:hypothetical protein